MYSKSLQSTSKTAKLNEEALSKALLTEKERNNQLQRELLDKSKRVTIFTILAMIYHS